MPSHKSLTQNCFLSEINGISSNQSCGLCHDIVLMNKLDKIYSKERMLTSSFQHLTVHQEKVQTPQSENHCLPLPCSSQFISLNSDLSNLIIYCNVNTMAQTLYNICMMAQISKILNVLPVETPQAHKTIQLRKIKASHNLSIIRASSLSQNHSLSNISVLSGTLQSSAFQRSAQMSKGKFPCARNSKSMMGRTFKIKRVFPQHEVYNQVEVRPASRMIKPFIRVQNLEGQQFAEDGFKIQLIPCQIREEHRRNEGCIPYKVQSITDDRGVSSCESLQSDCFQLQKTMHTTFDPIKQRDENSVIADMKALSSQIDAILSSDSYSQLPNQTHYNKLQPSQSKALLLVSARQNPVIEDALSCGILQKASSNPSQKRVRIRSAHPALNGQRRYSKPHLETFGIQKLNESVDISKMRSTTHLNSQIFNRVDGQAQILERTPCFKGATPVQSSQEKIFHQKTLDPMILFGKKTVVKSQSFALKESSSIETKMLTTSIQDQPKINPCMTRPPIIKSSCELKVRIQQGLHGGRRITPQQQPLPQHPLPQAYENQSDPIFSLPQNLRYLSHDPCFRGGRKPPSPKLQAILNQIETFHAGVKEGIISPKFEPSAYVPESKQAARSLPNNKYIII